MSKTKTPEKPKIPNKQRTPPLTSWFFPFFSYLFCFELSYLISYSSPGYDGFGCFKAEGKRTIISKQTSQKTFTLEMIIPNKFWILPLLCLNVAVLCFSTCPNFGDISFRVTRLESLEDIIQIQKFHISCWKFWNILRCVAMSGPWSKSL